MNNINSQSITQTNESSYKIINYPNIKKNSFISSETKLNTQEKQTMPNKQLFSQLNSYRAINNNKKDFILDEDDIKNNENFKIFMDDLLSKDKSTETISFVKTNIVNNNNNSNNKNDNNILSNQSIFINKRNGSNNKKYNTCIKNIKKEEDLLYIFYRNKNKIRNKTLIKIRNEGLPLQFDINNYIESLSKKRNQQIMNNTKTNNNNDLDINKNILDNKNSLLTTIQKERKSIGIECKIIKKRNTKLFKNNINDNMPQLSSTFSLKEFDGRMLNNLDLNKICENISKKQKIKNNSFNHIKKAIPDYKIPKIIFFSRNKDRKNKRTEHKLNTMKEKVLHFLKDKSYDSLNRKIINNNEKNDLNRSKNYNNNISKNILNPITKIKFFLHNESYLIPYIKNFEKSYNKKVQKQNMNIKNKKIFYSSFKNKDYYNFNNNLKNITITNIKE